MNSTTIVVDDSNTAQITYKGDWFPTAGLSEFNYTSHGTLEDGATATLVFNGTSVAVFGTIDTTEGNSTSTYVLDGSTVPSIFTPNLTSTVLYEQLFYQSPILPDGQHTLVVTFAGSAAPFWLDYFSYTCPYASTPTATPTPTLTATPMATPSPSFTATVTVTAPTSTVTATVILSVPVPSSTSTGVSPATQPSNAMVKVKVPAAAIAVGTIGGFALLAAVLLMFFLCWRRRRRRSEVKDKEIQAGPGMTHAVATPFHPPPSLPPLPVMPTGPPPSPPSPSEPRPSSLPAYPYALSRASYPTKKIYDDPSHGYQVYDPTNPYQSSGSVPMTYDPFSSTPIHLGFPTQTRPLEKGTLRVMNPGHGEGDVWSDHRTSIRGEIPPSYGH